MRFGWECDWCKDCARKKRSESSLRAKSGLSTSMAEVVQRAALSPRATRALAMCGAFRGLTRASQSGVLESTGRGATAGCRWLTRPAPKNRPRCRAPTEWEEILRDYYQLGLSTGRHPLAVLRPRLRSLGSLEAPRPGNDRQRQHGARQRAGDSSAASADGQGRGLRFARGRDRHQQHHLLAGRVRGRATQHHRHDSVGRVRRAAERERSDSCRRPAASKTTRTGSTDCPASRGTFIEVTIGTPRGCGRLGARTQARG